MESSQVLVQANVISKLNYCNSWLVFLQVPVGSPMSLHYCIPSTGFLTHKRHKWTRSLFKTMKTSITTFVGKQTLDSRCLEEPDCPLNVFKSRLKTIVSITFEQPQTNINCIFSFICIFRPFIDYKIAFLLSIFSQISAKLSFQYQYRVFAELGWLKWWIKNYKVLNKLHYALHITYMLITYKWQIHSCSALSIPLQTINSRRSDEITLL